MDIQTIPIPIQITKTRQQIATELGICVKTLVRKLAKANVILPSGLLTPKEQYLIYELFNCKGVS